MHTLLPLPRLRLFALVLLSCGVFNLAPAAEPASGARPPSGSSATGDIAGRVFNQASGAYLEGAEIAVAGTNLRTLSARDGSFRLTGVAAGRQQVEVFYTGLNRQSLVVDVPAGRAAELTVELSAEVYRLEAFTVSGQREGNAVAITRQKNADNIVNVISTDAYGNIADGNIGNFMQRLPGVSAIYAEGDIIGIGLRGIPPNQSAVTLDGALMTAAVAGSAANVQGDRAPPLDRLPADFIKEIEVFKAPTPDRPVNGLGGSANLITKSAFDFKQRVITYRGGANRNLYRSGSPFSPTGSFTFMDVLGPDRRLAVTLSSSYTQTVNTRDRVQSQRSETDARNTQARLLNDVYDRVRWGYSGKLEYKLTPRTLIAGDILYTNFLSDTRRYNVQANDSATRRVADYRLVSRAQIEAGTQPRTATNQTASVAPGFTDTFTEMLNANWVNQSALEIRRGHQYKFGAALTTQLAGADLQVRTSYSPAAYDNNYLGFTSTLRGVGLAIDSSQVDRPRYTQTYGPSIYADTDFTRYTADYFEQPDRTEEEIATAQIDAERPFATRLPFVLKAGLMWSEQHRLTATWRPTWNYVGPDRVAGRNAATGVNDDNLAQFLEPGLGYAMFRSRYPQFRFLDIGKIQTARAANPAWFAPVGTSVTDRAPLTEVTETVTAGYLMGRLRVERLQVVAGVRVEETDVDALGRLTDPRNPGVTTTRVGRDYGEAFPSVHFRYEARRNLRLRASYSTSMARPSIAQITPNTTINYVSEVVTQGNPGLSPQYSKNYDVSLEYYFEPAGVLSVGAYQKDLSGYIFTRTSEIGSGTGNGFGGDLVGFDLRTSTNGGSARIRGVEINYSQSLNFLPRPLNGLSAFANLTVLRSRGTFDEGESELANYVPRTGNLGLSYSWRKLQCQVAANYQAAHLFMFNSNPLLRQYRDRNWTLDVNAQVRFRPWLTVFADVTNLLNEWPNIYNGQDARRNLFSEVFGSRLSVGVSGRF
jgi:TonB-dependent receptor